MDVREAKAFLVIIHSKKGPKDLFLVFTMIFLFAIFTTINLFFFVCKYEDMIQSLLDRSDTTRVFTTNHIFDFFWKFEKFFLNDFFILDDIDRNIVINES